MMAKFSFVVVVVSVALLASVALCQDDCFRCARTICRAKQTCTVNKANHRPECVRCPDACTLQYDPVCGCDGKTYGNACALKVAACKAKRFIVMKHKGACKDDCSRCARTTCPTNQTCTVDKSNHRPVCVNCPFGCTREYEPVCGCDGKTYPTFCVMKMAACEGKRFIVMQHEGRCKDNTIDGERSALKLERRL